MAISINKVSKEIQEKVIQAYQNNMSLREIEKQFGVTRPTVSKFLEANGIKTQKGNHYRKYQHNENYFEIINTEEKAYWLGFIFADGYIQNHDNLYGQDAVGITIAEYDKDVLEKFKKSIEATNPIILCKKTGEKGANCVRILLTSQKTANDLIDKGCYKNKSSILKPPKKVPSNLIRHFIRGLFDGDGSLIKYEHKECNSISYQINFTTTYEMADWLREQIQMGSTYPEKRRESTWYFGFGGNQQVINFYHYLYDDATIWMDRKYNRFQELLSKYSES